MTTFLGMRGNGNWTDDMRPLNWRQGILYRYPNGEAPLTGLLSMLGEEKVPDPQYHWWTQGLPAQRGTVTEVYTGVMATAYTTGGVAGDTLYVNISTEETCKEFRVGHQVLLRNSANYADDTNAKVTAVVLNGTSSYVAVKLLEDDPTTTGIADCNTILVIGNINAEGAAMPGAIATDPVKFYNYTQIFRTPLSITRTARMTNMRTGDNYKKAKREALQMHSVEMEKAFLQGIRTENTGSNGKPERTTWGLIPFLRDNDGIVSDFTTQTDFTDVTWLDSGEEWLDYNLEQVFRYGSGERVAFCGSGVILAINKLIKEYGNFEFTPKTKAYGINVTEWHTPFGMINMIRHPLFSYETTNRYSMVVFEPESLKYKYITDTTFYADPDKQNTGRGRIDGTDEEYLTECGLEFQHSNGGAWLNGFNSDNGTP